MKVIDNMYSKSFACFRLFFDNLLYPLIQLIPPALLFLSGAASCLYSAHRIFLAFFFFLMFLSYPNRGPLREQSLLAFLLFFRQYEIHLIGFSGGAVTFEEFSQAGR